MLKQKLCFWLMAILCLGYSSAQTNTAAQNGNWNHPDTWSLNHPPTAQEVVMIPQGKTIKLTKGNLYAKEVHINGNLRPKNRNTNFHLHTEQVHIMNGGKLTIGSAQTPHQGKAIFSLLGDKSDFDQEELLTGMGRKFIGVMSGGTLAMHGASTTSWTHLEGTVTAGATQIIVSDAVNWSMDDYIVIASSTTNRHEAEKLKISDISPDGKTITLATPLSHNHIGKIKNYEKPSDQTTWTVDMRAEVGLLSHNIKVQGDAASEIEGFGGHIMVMDGGKARMSGVELYRMGQKAVLGRYPFHWHLLGENGSNQYIKNSSIHHSFNRAVTIHGTWNTLVENNFCYDHIGHIFLEDGSEQGNVISKNVVLLTTRPTEGEELTPSDNQLDILQARTPASYWITNPNNIFTDNVAAGSQGTGFWFALPKDRWALPKTTPDSQQ